VLFQLLNEHEKINFNTKWREAKKIIADDEKFSKVAQWSERRLEKAFRDWNDERYDQVLSDFEALLRETKIITYKSQKMIQENEQHLRDILAVLENDQRYLVLKDCPEERERLLEEYLKELDRNGPPPPPTASQDPDKRGRK